MTTRKQKIEKYGKNANPRSKYAEKVARRPRAVDPEKAWFCTKCGERNQGDIFEHCFFCGVPK